MYQVHFATYFPTLVFLFRSRPVRRIAVGLFAIVGVTSLAFRIETAIWQHRVVSMVAQMRVLRVHETTRAELLRRIPQLRPASERFHKCEAEACLSIVVDNWTARGYSHFQKMRGYELAYRVAYWLGARVCSWYADVDIQDGKVSYFSYHLFLGTSDAFAIMVTAGTWLPLGREPLSPIIDESPDYVLTSYFKWPDLDLLIGLSRSASTVSIGHAFDVRLNCTWELLGCRNVRELLPKALDDKEAIERRTLLRLHSSDPCPDRILPRRVRDIPTILLVQVERAAPRVGGDELAEIVVDYKLVQVLKKGNVERSLDHVLHLADVWSYVDHSLVRNPVIPLLRPGQRLIMFAPESDSRTVHAPCEVVAATPSALATIQSALATAKDGQ